MSLERLGWSMAVATLCFAIFCGCSMFDGLGGAMIDATEKTLDDKGAQLVDFPAGTLAFGVSWLIGVVKLWMESRKNEAVVPV
jgi:hypothetical protein